MNIKDNEEKKLRNTQITQIPESPKDPKNREGGELPDEEAEGVAGGRRFHDMQFR